MKDESNNNPDNLLDQATALLRDSAGTEQPPQHIVDQTLLQLAAEDRSRRSIYQWRFTMFKNRSWAAAAAIVIMSAIAVFWVSQRSATVAFGAVVEKVRAISAVSFKMSGKVQIPNGPLQAVEAQVTVAEPSRMREVINTPDMVMIMDFAAGKQLMLDTKQKSATVVDMGKNSNPQIANMNVLDSFRKFDPKAFKSIGGKLIDQKKVVGFRMENPNMTQTVWVDPDTQLPVQMEMNMSGGMAPTADMVMTGFDWNPQINDAMFSLTPPADYHGQTLSMDMSNLGEKDLLDAIRRLAELNDGTLPDSLDMNGMMQAVKGLATKLGKDKQQDVGAMKKKAMDELAPIARGLGFIAKETDAHYAGKGVKLNEANRPILWYRPAGAVQYRVIDAELKVTEVDADHLPQVPSTPVGATVSPITPSTQPAKP